MAKEVLRSPQSPVRSLAISFASQQSRTLPLRNERTSWLCDPLGFGRNNLSERSGFKRITRRQLGYIINPGSRGR
jgi:hypothetical protein